MKSSSTFLIVLLALTTLGGAAWAWKEYQDLAQLRASLASSDDNSRDLQNRLADAQKRLKGLSDQLDALRNRNKAEVASGAEADDNRPRRGGNFGGFRAMLNNPQFQKLMSIQQKAMLDRSYASLFKLLNLSPAQLDQFKNLMVQRQQAVMDAAQAAREQGLSPQSDPAAFQQAIADAQTAVDNQIQAALGDAGYAQYQQYQQTLPQRNAVNQLQQSLSYTSAPLTSEQSDQLIQILAQTAPANSGGGGGFGGGAFGAGGGGGGMGQITDQAINQAQGLLSDSQIQALQQLQQQQQVQKQMQQLMRASRQGGG